MLKSKGGSPASPRPPQIICGPPTPCAAQLVNVVFFILPNAYVLTHACSWFHPVVLWSGFVRWVWDAEGRGYQLSRRTRGGCM